MTKKKEKWWKLSIKTYPVTTGSRMTQRVTRRPAAWWVSPRLAAAEAAGAAGLGLFFLADWVLEEAPRRFGLATGILPTLPMMRG